MNYIFAFFICCIPTVIHILNDKKGDVKKINDLIVLTLISVVLATVNRLLFDKSIAQSLGLAFGIHVLFFDYLIVYFLRKNGVIRKDAKVFSYTGSGKIDLVWARVNPLVRMVIRVAVFGSVVFYYIA